VCFVGAVHVPTWIRGEQLEHVGDANFSQCLSAFVADTLDLADVEVGKILAAKAVRRPCRAKLLHPEQIRVQGLTALMYFASDCWEVLANPCNELLGHCRSGIDTSNHGEQLAISGGDLLQQR